MNKPPIITAKHWLPDHPSDWTPDPEWVGDLREPIDRGLGVYPRHDPVLMNPEKPDPVKVISSNWVHADCHGIQTRTTFEHDLRNAIKLFVHMIKEDYPDGFEPVRIYKEAEPAYGVGFFDWKGGHIYNFDLRVVVQFGKWQFRTDKGHDVTAVGFKYHLATLVVPTADDHDVYVGRDFGALFDG